MNKITPRFFRIFLFLVIGVTLLSSCVAFEGEQTIPAYIHIDTILLTTNPATQGTKNAKITDAWVYVDDELIGAFELPATFPVLKSGKQTVRIQAGIKMNGIASTRIYYPFYRAYSKEITLVEEETDTLHPGVTYYDNTLFKWREDFENGGSSLEPTSKSDTAIVVVSGAGNTFEGTYSGALFLGDSAQIAEVATIESYTLPVGQVVFLELNYKTNNQLTIGVYGNAPGQTIQTPVLVLNPSSTWNKIYINLTPTIGNMSSATNYKIFFGMLRGEGVASPACYIDNVKLLTF
jgi:hypothetical protein